MRWLILPTLLILSPLLVSAGVISLSLERDPRTFISFDVFGFASGGHLEIKASGVSIESSDKSSLPLAGFLFLKVNSRVDIIPSDSESCLLEHTYANDRKFLVTSGQTLDEKLTISEEGYYALYFVNCAKGAVTSMDVHVVERNPDEKGGYLPVGQRSLPNLLLAFCFLEAALVLVWALILHRNRANVFKIHVVMASVPLLRVLFLFFESMRLRQIEAEGSATGWSVPYYIFAVLESTVLFVVVLLMGTGWSLTKPFLSDREKTIMKIILPLQLVADIAMILTGELAPGSPSLTFWNNVSRIVDVVCCCAVLFPVVWSIRQLKEGPRVKAVRRLEVFRSFYVSTVVYIYFTRIMVVLLRAVLSVENEFIGDVLVEVAALGYNAYAGWSFRPYQENPYMELQASDDEADLQDQERPFESMAHSEEGMD